jgi:uncharacterized delta-60 repeat protein
VRYNPDGSLDNTFNSTGVVTSTIGQAYALAIQSDGKIVVAGWSGSHILVARYTSTGTLDTTFNQTGVVTAAIGSSSSGNSIALQSDGKIVVAGGAEGYFVVVRYTITGGLDSTFNQTGVVTTDISPNNDEASSVAIQPDGKIVVGGVNNDWSHTIGVPKTDLVVARYTDDGRLDSTFNHTGIVTTSLSNGADKTYSLALQEDGKIVVGGWTTLDGITNYITLVRYLGGPDPYAYFPLIIKNQ